MEDLLRQVPQMFPKFRVHDNQGGLPSFIWPKITSTIFICYMYLFLPTLAKFFEVSWHACISRIAFLDVLLLNSSSWKIDRISSIGLVSTFCARQYKGTAIETFSTRWRSLLDRSIPSFFNQFCRDFSEDLFMSLLVLASCQLYPWSLIAVLSWFSTGDLRFLTMDDAKAHLFSFHDSVLCPLRFLKFM